MLFTLPASVCELNAKNFETILEIWEMKMLGKFWSPGALLIACFLC